MRGRSRHVKSWIPVKKADRLEREPDVGNWHDRPLLRARNMMHVHDVPHYKVGVVNRAVGLRPCGQAKATWMLIGIVACRVALLGSVRCHPQVFVNKTRTFQNTRCWMQEDRGVLTWHQLVSYRLA